MMDFVKTAEGIGTVAAALAAIWGLFKLVINPLITFAKNVMQFYATVQVIKKELQPNSGTSLKDRIDQIAKAQAEIVQIHSRSAEEVVRQQLRCTACANHNNKYGIIETDEAGIIVSVNRTSSHLHHRTVEELTGKGWKNAIYPADREKVIAEFDACLKEARDFSASYRVMSPKGELTWLHCHGYIMTHEKKLLGMIIYVEVGQDPFDTAMTT